jgi:uncharacterized protein (DUF362 family)
MLSVIADSSLQYPEEKFFSPDERFPEYPFQHLSSRINPVYRAVRECLAQAGLDQEGYGTSAWNPFGAFIRPGSRVFVLGNFVHHRRGNESAENFRGKCIHGSVLRALIDFVLLAVGEKGRVRFGNAALQSCDWDLVLEDTRAREVLEFYRTQGAPVEAKDLRLYLAERSRFSSVARVERRNMAEGVLINLGRDSLLAKLPANSAPFRVRDYNPLCTEAYHAHDKHIYVLHRNVLESEVIISLPKLKTHEKVGITCAIKGCVGAAGLKDCLAHHRFGPPDKGGDEYPADETGLLRVFSRWHDKIQQTSPEGLGGNILRLLDRGTRRGVQVFAPIVGGSWWGNDTAWRMAVDLARIVSYADAAGVMQAKPCRPHLACVDGIVGGEGQGPLKPQAVHSGLLLLADNPVIADYASAVLMGFNPDDLPIVREALKLAKFQLLEQELSNESVTCNQRKLSTIQELKKFMKHRFKPPYGWVKKL